MAQPVFLPYLLGQDFAAPADPWSPEEYWAPAELAFDGGGAPPITGSGASVATFTDDGDGLLVFEAMGTSAVAFADSGSGLLIFEAAGASVLVFADSGVALLVFQAAGDSVVVFTDVGVGLVLDNISGAGASELAFADFGAGSVSTPAAGGGGGGGFRFDWDKAFPRRRREPEEVQPRRKKAIKPEPPRVFAYAAENDVPLFTSVGAGLVSMGGEGESRFAFHAAGRGHMKESAAELVLLLMLDDEE